MASTTEQEDQPTTTTTTTSLQPIQPIKPLYCQICSFPPEYCEYGTSISKCKTWLSAHDQERYEEIYGGIEQELASMSVEEVEKKKKAETEALKKEAKEDAKASRIKEKSKTNKVTVKTVERTKRKRITTIHGLDLFGVDLKKLAKLFASKFATGSSVTKNNQGEDEIVIQGDVSDEVLDLFDSTTGKFAEIIGNGIIPDDNIVFVDDTKKKKPT
ncbi:Translation machinery-associated protein 22 [Puccinia graminis f. sp. tritici]|uniref:Translation machinery-associated protein 22 n=1 Tax=Puccinia graminis f. sp. tritici TaxID=56615 RepID=A0A5B0N807_PUCGR|nr:Translation machinery-associated protein 22 [Puccinia graminis f. sp. tritici]KAA1084643.1 Translation machinery-associated protein 22 [Puccinia graminis f. sp. tritici]